MSNAAVLREMTDAFVAHDYDLITSLLSETVTFDDVAAGTVAEGRDAVLEAFRKWEAAFPDIVIEPVTIVQTATGAAGEFVARGTQTGPLGELPATGNSIEVRFALIAEIEALRITGMREYYDAMTMMAQLELLPEMS